MTIRIIHRERKSPVLRKSNYGCLKGAHAINVSSGCAIGCVYCYAAGYPEAPGRDTVELYTNLPELLTKELDNPRKRERPRLVIFNTSTDCFQPHPEVLDLTYELFQILFKRGIGISFLTKGEIPERFFRLFEANKDKVRPIIGIASASDKYREAYEPNAAPPESRLAAIKEFIKMGIRVDARADPLIPFVTDTEESLNHLFSELSRVGIDRVTVSYLHIRPGIEKVLMPSLKPMWKKLLESCFPSDEWLIIGGVSRARLVPAPLRKKGYEKARRIAGEYGISVDVCMCKNPDIDGTVICSASRKASIELAKAGESPEAGTKQLALFLC